MSFDMKSLATDTTIAMTAQLWGKDDPAALTPSNFSIASVVALMSANAAVAVVQTVAANYGIPPLSNTNTRILTVVATATASITLPSPVENVIINVKAAPGVTGVQVLGHTDNVSGTTSAVPAGSSVQLHGSTTTWWVV
jgi:hypothetical protein